MLRKISKNIDKYEHFFQINKNGLKKTIIRRLLKKNLKYKPKKKFQH